MLGYSLPINKLFMVMCISGIVSYAISDLGRLNAIAIYNGIKMKEGTIFVARIKLIVSCATFILGLTIISLCPYIAGLKDKGMYVLSIGIVICIISMIPYEMFIMDMREIGNDPGIISYIKYLRSKK
jgi:hypothetical protein